MIPTRMNPMGLQPYSLLLSYLESTGTQYIDTGVLPHKDMIVDIDCYFAASLNEYLALFGARVPDASNLNAFIIWHDIYYTQKPRFDYGQDMVSADNYTYPITNFRKEGTKNYINGTLVGENTAVSDLVCNYTCRLFSAGSLDVRHAKIKVSRCRIWQTGTSSLTRDLIPVLDKSGVPCMYDLCTRSLFYNAGSGTFNYA